MITTNISIDITNQINDFKNEMQSYGLKNNIITRLVHTFVFSHLNNIKYVSPLLEYYDLSSLVHKQALEGLTRHFSKVIGVSKAIGILFNSNYISVEVRQDKLRFYLKLEVIDGSTNI